MTFADLLGTPHEIEFEGKVYLLPPPDLNAQARFTRWLQRRAREDAGKAAEDLPPDAADRYMAQTRRDIAAGVFDWGGEVSGQAATTPVGAAKLIHILLGPSYPEADEAFCRRLVDARIGEIAGLLAAAEADPEGKAAAAVTAFVTAASSLFSSPTPPTASPPTSSGGSPTPS